MPTRRRAAILHLLFSAGATLVASLVVFLVWFPPPFAQIAGGFQLFLLVVSVDVVIGPALTAVVASPGKSRREFVFDVAVIVVVQCAALGYGAYTMALARPVALVHEVDLFRLVSAADLEASSLAKSQPQFQILSWRGPRLIVAVKPERLDEQLRSIELSLAGVQLAMLPEYWRDYDKYVDLVWSSARPIQLLLARYPAATADVAKAAAASGESPQALRFLPLVARRKGWVALVALRNATIVGYLPLDGQF